MQELLNSGGQKLVRSVHYREHKRVEAELTVVGRAQAELVARRLVEAFNDRFRDDPELRGGEPRVNLLLEGSVVYRYPPQNIKPQRLD